MDDSVNRRAVPRKLLVALLLAAVGLGLLATNLLHRRKVLAEKRADLSGEWVGTLAVTGYRRYRDDPQPLDRPAVIYFKAIRTEGPNNSYRGPGLLTIAGVHNPQDIQLASMFLLTSSPRVIGEITWDWGHGLRGSDIEGTLTEGGELQVQLLGITSAEGLFQGNLHRGSLADYNKLRDGLGNRE